MIASRTPVEDSLRSAGQAVSADTRRQTVWRMHGAEATETDDALAVEEPLEIQLRYGPAGERKEKSISVTMRTPGDDFELAAGFLLTEGVVQDSSDIEEVRYVSQPHVSFDEDGDKVSSVRNAVCITLVPAVEVNLASLERNFYTTSSCGICGKASLLALRSVCPPRRINTFAICASVLYQLPDRLRATQKVFDQTGGLHAAALFRADGTLEALKEDVGRHNAVDKLIGAAALADELPLRERLLLLSGRASFELLQKAVMGGIPMVASVGAPSSLAVQVAKEFDITLVGFLRDNRCNIYHGKERIQMEEANDG